MSFRSLFRTKLPTSPDENNSLNRCLSAVDLTLMGIGAIIGAGVFVLTGLVAAEKAGPGVVFSYMLAGFASMLAALCYAEMASSVGGCGSAYHYAYSGLGELIAWLIGWNLIFEYALSVSTVAIGWSGYMHDFLVNIHLALPVGLTKTPQEGGIINLPAVIIIALLSVLLCVGVRQSVRFNTFIVAVKLLTIALFIGVAVFHVNIDNWQDFLPFGWLGVAQGASLVFFAYIGFDALSTAVEEARDPQRTVPIGIIASMLICTLIYIIVSLLITGIVPYKLISIKAPVADALLQIGYPVVASFIAVGAIAGLTTVMLVMYYGLTRICLAISRDGLLPAFFAKIHPTTRTPIRVILLFGVIMSLVAGFLPLGEAAELVNIGTLTAFIFVCIGVIVLRIIYPNMHRPFKLPLNPLFPVLGIIFCGYLMINLPSITWIRFLIWLILGIVIYFFYGRKNSAMHSI